MSSASTVRRQLAEIARRLVALIDESVAPARAVQILVAENVLPPQSNDASARPLASAIESLSKHPAIDLRTAERVGAYVGACEAQGRGDTALRLLGRLKIQRARGRTSLGVIGVEFVLLMVVLLIHSIFVLPQFQAMFDSVGAPMPAFTQLVYALIRPSGPFIYLGIFVVLLVLVWRRMPFLFGPLIRPLDRLLQALPMVGPAIRQNNSDRLSGWLGFAAADRSAQSIAIEAAEHWYRGDVLSRACAAILRDLSSGRDLAACLSTARGFDHAFHAVVSIPDREDSLAALRARWHVADTLPEYSSPLAPALAQLVFGIVVAAIVIAMYLPIFKLGSLM